MPEYITDAERAAFSRGLHQIAEERAESVRSSLADGRRYPLMYPPDAQFSVEENAALRALYGDAAAASAIAMLVRSAIAAAFFDALNLIDGTATPPGAADWATYHLCRNDGVTEPLFLHEDFLASYSER